MEEVDKGFEEWWESVYKYGSDRTPLWNKETFREAYKAGYTQSQEEQTAIDIENGRVSLVSNIQGTNDEIRTTLNGG